MQSGYTHCTCINVIMYSAGPSCFVYQNCNFIFHWWCYVVYQGRNLFYFTVVFFLSIKVIILHFTGVVLSLKNVILLFHWCCFQGCNAIFYWCWFFFYQCCNFIFHWCCFVSQECNFIISQVLFSLSRL
jgi:hypothetical protein